MNTLSRRRFFAVTGAAAATAAFGRSLLAEDLSASSLSVANAAFAFDLYAKLRADEGNVFISPFSISTALAMSSAGAKGKTLDEMNKVLHLPKDPHAGFGELIGRMNGAGAKRAYQLTTANALFAQSDYPWRPEFAALTRKHYGAGLVEVDFKTNPDACRLQINAWVEKETKEKIKDLIPLGVIKALTRMVLTNAVHFKGNWASQFKKEMTKDAPFHLAGGGKADVPLMNQEGTFGYGEYVYGFMKRSGDRAQVVELPYVGKELSMLVFLPSNDDLPALEAHLSAKTLAEVTRQMKPEKVDVSLPRFKMEYGTKSLVKPLQDLGMTAAFGPGADLTGMHSGSEELYISEVLHKAFVDVNEEGTEAAAATAVVVDRSPSPPPPKPKVFRADRPFAFLIRENATGSILFLGRCIGPKA